MDKCLPAKQGATSTCEFVAERDSVTKTVADVVDAEVIEVPATPIFVTVDVAERNVPHKPQRFRFNPIFELVFLRAATETEAHLAEYGKGEERYEQVLDIFMASHEYVAKASSAGPGGLSAPRLKTLWDKAKELIKERRREVNKSVASSGTNEPFGEREQLLDAIIEESDAKDEQERADKQIVRVRELILQKSGEGVRNMALKRMSAKEGEENKVGTPKKQKRNATMFSLDFEGADEELKMIRKEADNRRKQEEKRLELDERRLVLEEKRIKIDEERRKDDIESRKLERELLMAMLSKMGK